MKYTVLGGSGVIGRALVRSLLAQGAEVFVPEKGSSEVFNRPLGHVIYAIGVTGDFRKHPFNTVDAHVSYLSKVLQFADFESLLYLSSTRVYLGQGVDEGREDSKLKVNPEDPSDLYNLSKLLGESLCRASGRVGVKIARLSNVVGGNDLDSDNFLPSIIREATAGKLVLKTDPSSSKDYIHIDDAIDQIIKISERGKWGIYNVASGKLIPHLYWLDQLEELLDYEFEVVEGASLIRSSPIDITRIENEFCFSSRSLLGVIKGYLW